MKQFRLFSNRVLENILYFDDLKKKNSFRIRKKNICQWMSKNFFERWRNLLRLLQQIKKRIYKII